MVDRGPALVETLPFHLQVVQAQGDGLHGQVGGDQFLHGILKPLPVLVGPPLAPLLQFTDPRGQGMQSVGQGGIVAPGQAAGLGQIHGGLEALEQGFGALEFAGGQVGLQLGEALRQPLEPLGRVLVLFAQARIEGSACLGKLVRQGLSDPLGRQDRLSLLQQVLDLLVFQWLGLGQQVRRGLVEFGEPLVRPALGAQVLAMLLSRGTQGRIVPVQGGLFGLRQGRQCLPAHRRSGYRQRRWPPHHPGSRPRRGHRAGHGAPGAGRRGPPRRRSGPRWPRGRRRRRRAGGCADLRNAPGKRCRRGAPSRPTGGRSGRAGRGPGTRYRNAPAFRASRTALRTGPGPVGGVLRPPGSA